MLYFKALRIIGCDGNHIAMAEKHYCYNAIIAKSYLDLPVHD
jgi:hypothetical protein